MLIHRAGSRPSVIPTADYFTGTVRFDPVITADAPSRVTALIVTFEPGARTAWHTHPLGQTIQILSGTCWAQKDGEAVVELHPGDVAYFAPGEKHWHGASAKTAMSHLAIQEGVDGVTADWLNHVSDDAYMGPKA